MKQNSIKLVVGLGNPGHEYVDTRHNAGFWLVDQLANKYHAKFEFSSKYYGEIAKFNFQQQDIFLLKPSTYMNLSGKSVQALTGFYKISPEQIIVAHDELYFNCGIIKLKFGGGNGGHNGLKDIDRVIGKNYWRIRLGIGNPEDRSKIVGYVLQKPIDKDLTKINIAINNVLDNFKYVLTGDFNVATQKLHISNKS